MPDNKALFRLISSIIILLNELGIQFGNANNKHWYEQKMSITLLGKLSMW